MNAVIRFMVVAAAVLVLGSCGKEERERSYVPVIRDTANIWNRNLIDRLSIALYPKGIPFVFESVEALPANGIGSIANDFFAVAATRHASPGYFEDYGVYVLVSKQPALIQVRVGSSIYVPAVWGGVASGPRYLEIQSRSIRGEFSESTEEMFRWLATELPVRLQEYEQRKPILGDQLSGVFSELEELTFPSDNIYDWLFLKPFLWLRTLEFRLIGTYALTFLALGGVLFFAGKIILSSITSRLRKFNASLAVIVGIILYYALEFLLAFPSIVSLALLANARVEDQLALRAIGLDSLAFISLDPGLFLARTGLWLGIIVGVVRVLSLIGDNGVFWYFALFPADEQKSMFERMYDSDDASALLFMLTAGSREIGDNYNPESAEGPFSVRVRNSVIDAVFAGFRWGVFCALVLPKLFSIALLSIWLWPALAGTAGVLSASGTVALKEIRRTLGFRLIRIGSFVSLTTVVLIAIGVAVTSRIGRSEAPAKELMPQGVRRPAGVDSVAGRKSSSRQIIVPAGKTVGAFTFSAGGSLSYKGRSFHPAVDVKPGDTRAFRIYIRKDKRVAGAIAEDVDGLNRVFLLDLGALRSTPLQKDGLWSTGQEIFWSPSGRYMLALCSYEGQNFDSIDLQTRDIIKGGFLGSKGTIWLVADTPRWAGSRDVLNFTVAETCNPYDVTNCDTRRVLAKYSIRLDPATLKVTSKKLKQP